MTRSNQAQSKEKEIEKPLQQQESKIEKEEVEQIAKQNLAELKVPPKLTVRMPRIGYFERRTIQAQT